MGRKELFEYLDLPKIGDREPVADTIAMMLEFVKYQGEVAYELGKRQAISITSTASTIGIGWAAFFFGIAQGSWFTSSLGLMVVFGATFLLAYWTPRMMNSLRDSLDGLAEAKFYKKWVIDPAKSMLTERSGDGESHQTGGSPLEHA